MYNITKNSFATFSKKNPNKNLKFGKICQIQYFLNLQQNLAKSAPMPLNYTPQITHFSTLNALTIINFECTQNHAPHLDKSALALYNITHFFTYCLLDKQMQKLMSLKIISEKIVKFFNFLNYLKN